MQAGIYVSLNNTSPARRGDVQVDLVGSFPVFTLHGVFADPGKLKLAVLTIQQILLKLETLKRFDGDSSNAFCELQAIRERAHDIFHGPVVRHIKTLRASMAATARSVDALESVMYDKIAELLSVKAPKKSSIVASVSKRKKPTGLPQTKVPRIEKATLAFLKT